jgi:3-dehydroquinate synthetase
MAMQQLDFVFADRATVPGWLGSNARAEVIQRILDVKPDRILLVTDETVDKLHGDYFAPLFRGETGQSPDVTEADAELPILLKKVLPCGDACKSWTCLTELMEWAFKVGATKSTLVVAFGGGALINVTGLFASMLYRGSKVIYVPTTLLAMHDVTTSLKTSICFDGRKNNIGTFYAPLKILIDTDFCSTLPRAELFSGIGELAKNAALLGGEHARGFTEALSSDRIDARSGGSGEEFTLDDATLIRLLELGIEAKMSVLLTDAYEKVNGMIFEYGHTVSHAIEKAYGDGTIPHGLGVVYGMLSSSYAAEQQGIMSAEDRAEHDKLCHLLLQKWPLPKPMPSAELVMDLAMRDSKRGLTGEAEDEISDVILRKMGDIVNTKTNNLSKFPAYLVHEWLLQTGFPHNEYYVSGSAKAQMSCNCEPRD